MIKLSYHPWFQKAISLYADQTNPDKPKWRNWLKSTFNGRVEYDAFDGQVLVFENKEDVVTFKLTVG